MIIDGKDLETLKERNCGNCLFKNTTLNLKLPNIACFLLNENYKNIYCCYLHQFEI